ncbi:MAG: sigma-70 family RNA polymerase sigma factor [Myxococcales bacterium]|nr:sigma-70 family RNA polymerase sigma factor [Myxococcales bacterium]
MDDWKLLEAWQAGKSSAGEALVNRYLGLLTRFFRNKVGNPEDAAELISETLLGCTRGKERVRDSEAFRSFLLATAMNVLRRHYRKKAKRERELDDFADICVGDSGHPRSPGSMVALEQESRLLVRALRRIPLEYQLALELHLFEGLNGREIAELLGVPQPTVYTRLRRGKERLRGVMHELADSPEVADSTMAGLQTWAARVRDEITR